MAKRVPITVQTYFLLEKSWPGEFFRLRHFLESPTAHAQNIENLPTMNELALIRSICVELLDPLRRLWEGPLTLTSGFRSPELNRAVGGSATSDHLCQIGAAVDLRPSDPSQAGIRQLMRFIVENSRYGEFWADSGPNTERLKDRNAEIAPPSPPVNGGEQDSGGVGDHRSAKAAPPRPVGLPPLNPPHDVAGNGRLEFDQLILYEGRVHIGYRPLNNRFELRKHVVDGKKSTWPEIMESEI